jgi:hypothetical protein
MLSWKKRSVNFTISRAPEFGLCSLVHPVDRRERCWEALEGLLEPCGLNKYWGGLRLARCYRVSEKAPVAVSAGCNGLATGGRATNATITASSFVEQRTSIS